MNIGIAASANAQATAERCAELGIKHVFLNCPSLPGYREHGVPDRGEVTRLKRELEDEGLCVPSASCWFLKWPPRPWRGGGATHPDALLSGDRDALDAMCSMVEVLGEVGISSVLHYVDIGKPPDGSQAEACWDALVAAYAELIAVAERAGVYLATHSLHRLLQPEPRARAVADGANLEDYGSYTTEGWGGPFLVATWQDLRRLIQAVPSPHNGITLCTGMDIVGGEVPALVREFSDRIHFCQIRDHSDRWPGGQEVGLGRGRVPLPAIVAALREIGYQGIAHPEHLGTPDKSGEDPLQQAVTYLNAL